MPIHADGEARGGVEPVKKGRMNVPRGRAGYPVEIDAPKSAEFTIEDELLELGLINPSLEKPGDDGRRPGSVREREGNTLVDVVIGFQGGDRDAGEGARQYDGASGENESIAALPNDHSELSLTMYTGRPFASR